MNSAEPRTLDRVGTDPLTRRVAIVAAIAVALAAVTLAAQVLGSEDGGSSYLLEPAAPQLTRAAFEPLMASVSPEDLVGGAEIVFVGTVVGFGDPVPMGHGDPEAEANSTKTGYDLTVRTVHFAVARMLRGEPAAVRDFLYPNEGGAAAIDFTPGERLLVFARHVTFGRRQVEGITPVGYQQGVFGMESDKVARHEGTGVRMSVPALADALRR